MVYVLHAYSKRIRHRYPTVVPKPGCGSATALFHWETWLGAIQSLDLGLLVDAEHKRLVRRIEIQPDHIVQLFDEPFIAAQFEGFRQMRLETMLLPERVALTH